MTELPTAPPPAGASPREAATWLARNAVDCLPDQGLEGKLELGRPLRVKLGIDPTAPDIHFGFTVVLQKLREFQDLGHIVVLIIGDYTARVGDPSGRSATRPVLAPEEIDANAETFQAQALKVLDSERLEVRHNSEWLDMSMADLFKLARTTTVAQLLERDDFAKRFAAHQPISVLELLYPLLQGYDSVAVRADVELGGTDQKFNLLLGRQIQRLYGQPEQVILTMPLLTGTDGELKMSKSGGNYIGVTDPPDQMYGKTLSIPDGSLESWYALLLGSSPPADSSAARRQAGARACPGQPLPRSRRGRQGRGRVRPPVRPAPAPRGHAHGHVAVRPGRRPPAGAAGRRVRDLDLRGSAQPGPGRREAGRGGDRQPRSRSPGLRRRRQGAPARQAPLRAGSGGVTVHGGLLRLETPGNGHIVDITPGVQSVLGTAGIDRGLVTVFATGSTVAITTMEYEPGGVHDLQALLDRLIPAGPEYEHNRRNHDTNAHAHLRAAVIGPSESIPVVDGRLALGTWQQVVLIDFDDRPRRRTVTVQVLS